MARRRPFIAITATQRPTQDWDGSLTLVQVRISAQYAEAVYQAGGTPLVVPTFTGSGPAYVSGRGWPETRPEALKNLKKEAESLIRGVSGLLLTGGGDVLLREEKGAPLDRAMDRDRDFWEESLLFAALKFNKPVLGICRGLQLMNVALGGSLWDDIPSQIPSALKHQQNSKRHLTSHKVIFEPKSQLAAIFGQTEILVNSGHHQGVKELAPFLTVAGRSEDGIVEAVEMMDTPGVIGVQWHPEALIGGGPVYLSLFQALVAIAKKG